MQHEDDWAGEPITTTTSSPHPFRVKRAFFVAPGFRAARLHIAAPAYEAYLNGTRVGDELLTSGYREWDITRALVPGGNVFGAWVVQAHSEEGAVLVAQIEVDGHIVAASGDGPWCFDRGPVSLSEGGQVYDSTAADPAWCTAADTFERWEGCAIAPWPRIVRGRGYVAADFVTPSLRDGVLDFGGMFGVLHVLSQPMPESGTVTFRHAQRLEDLEGAGEGDTDTIVLGGKVAGYEPKFTARRFRFVRVGGWAVGAGDVLGIALRLSTEPDIADEGSPGGLTGDTRIDAERLAPADGSGVADVRTFFDEYVTPNGRVVGESPEVLKLLLQIMRRLIMGNVPNLEGGRWSWEEYYEIFTQRLESHDHSPGTM